MDLSDGGDVGQIRRSLLDAAPITFGTVPIYEAYNFGVEKHKNPLDITEDDYLNAFENNIKDLRQISNGLLMQDINNITINKRNLKIVTKRKPKKGSSSALDIPAWSPTAVLLELKGA